MILKSPMAGNTSEDVEAALGEGQFGMPRNRLLHQRDRQAGVPHPHWLRRGCRTILDHASSRRSIRSPAFLVKLPGAESRHHSPSHRHGHFAHAPAAEGTRSAPPPSPISGCFAPWCGRWMRAVCSQLGLCGASPGNLPEGGFRRSQIWACPPPHHTVNFDFIQHYRPVKM